MTVNAFALSVTPEQAIAPGTMFNWLMSKITARSMRDHILAITKLEV